MLWTLHGWIVGSPPTLTYLREEEKLAQATAKQLVPEIISLFDQIDADTWLKRLS